MKVRVGFVSNSSSASFVMVGVDIDELGVNKDELARVLAKEYGVDKYENLYDVCHELQNDESNPKFAQACEGQYFGITIARWTSEEATPDYNLDLAEVDQLAMDVENLLEDVGCEVEAKLIGGEEVC